MSYKGAPAEGVYEFSRGFKAVVRTNGVRQSKSFTTLDEAVAWRAANLQSPGECVVCGNALPKGARRNTVTCSMSCRNKRRDRNCIDCDAPIHASNKRCKPCAAEAQAVPREQVLAALRELSRQLGRTPKSREMLEAGISPSKLTKRFGSYPLALRLAGLEPNPRTKPRIWSAEAIVDALRDWASRNDGWPPPRSAGRSEGVPCPHTVEKYFGSWKAGIEAAGLRPRPVGYGSARYARSAAPQKRGGRNRQMVSGGQPSGVTHLDAGDGHGSFR